MNNNPYSDPSRSTEKPQSIDYHFLIGLARGLAGAILGGVIGYYVYLWAIRQGFDALAIPGALLGFGFNLAARRSHLAYGVIAAALALVLSLYAEWSTSPFVADNSLMYFITHLHQLRPFTWVMIVIATAVAFSSGRGRG